MPGRESAFAPAGRKPSKSDTTNVTLQARTNPHDLKYQAGEVAAGIPGYEDFPRNDSTITQTLRYPDQSEGYHARL